MGQSLSICCTVIIEATTFQKVFYGIFHGQAVTLGSANPHFAPSIRMLYLYLFVELYILAELGMTAIFKRLCQDGSGGTSETWLTVALA